MRYEYEARSRCDLVEWVVPFFKQGDFALTLTFKPTFHQNKLGFQHSFVWAYKTIGHYLNLVNRKMVGWHSSKPKRRLNYFGTLETNSSNGLHFHIILERPTYMKIPKHESFSVLINEWVGMREGGLKHAQWIEPVRDVKDWVYYITKDLDSSLMNVDFKNLELKTR